jgi:anti-anti-sigma factor
MYCQQATFERRDRDGCRTLIVSGEIDLVVAASFRDELRALIDEARSPAVVDLSGVTFLDSSGLSALVAARHEVEGTDVELVLLDPPHGCERLLGITGLDRYFEIRYTCPEGGE